MTNELPPRDSTRWFEREWAMVEGRLVDHNGWLQESLTEAPNDYLMRIRNLYVSRHTSITDKERDSFDRALGMCVRLMITAHITPNPDEVDDSFTSDTFDPRC